MKYLQILYLSASERIFLKFEIVLKDIKKIYRHYTLANTYLAGIIAILLSLVFVKEKL